METVSARCGGKEGSARGDESGGWLGRGEHIDVAGRSRANCRSARAGFAGDATHLDGVRAARRTHGCGSLHASSHSRLVARAGGRKRRARAGRQTCNARHRSWFSRDARGSARPKSRSSAGLARASRGEDRARPSRCGADDESVGCSRDASSVSFTAGCRAHRGVYPSADTPRDSKTRTAGDKSAQQPVKTQR